MTYIKSDNIIKIILKVRIFDNIWLILKVI